MSQTTTAGPPKSGRILGNPTGTVYRIRPHVHKWAWDLYLKAQDNTWNPLKIPMATDIEQWRSASALTDAERLLMKRCLGFFAGSESLVADNLLSVAFRFVQDPECKQYIGRQNAEELIHNHTIVYICDSLKLDEEEVYGAYRSIPAIRAKDDFLMGITRDTSGGFYLPEWTGSPSAADVEAYQAVLRNLITYYVVCEGTFFYSGFAMLLAFRRENKMPGICQQIDWTLRDETLHVAFGTRLINEIVAQQPEIWSDGFREETVAHIKRTVELENDYARECLPVGILGMRSEMFLDYIRYIANRRLEGIGLRPIYPAARNPFGWMTEAIDLTKLKNFFERTVTSYAKASALVDDL